MRRPLTSLVKKEIIDKQILNTPCFSIGIGDSNNEIIAYERLDRKVLIGNGTNDKIAKTKSFQTVSDFYELTEIMFDILEDKQTVSAVPLITWPSTSLKLI